MATAPLRSAQGRPLFRRWGRLALDLLFPPRCAVCGAMGAFLCPACLSSMPGALPPRCPVCWRPGRFTPACESCREQPPAFRALRAPYLMAGAARDAVHALKYSHFSALAEDMGRLMAEFAASSDPSGLSPLGRSLDADLVVPVPLHGRRRRSRGYNQSALLARAVGGALGLPVNEGALVRRRDGPRQARAASAEERRRNVEGAFLGRSGLEGSRVLLIDDVTTTGATLDACARALREAGTSSVCCLAFARED